MNKSVIVEIQGNGQSFTEAIDLSTGMVKEVRYAGTVGQFRESCCNRLQSSIDAQSIVDMS